MLILEVEVDVVVEVEVLAVETGFPATVLVSANKHAAEANSFRNIVDCDQSGSTKTELHLNVVVGGVCVRERDDDCG